MLAGLDTNILAYAEGVGDSWRCERARSLIEQLPLARVFVPAQALGELYRVLTGKSGIPPAQARSAALSWSDALDVADSTHAAFIGAFDLAADHDLQIWDALIVAVTVENRGRVLLSEDMQDGFTWHGVTVVNPFASSPSPLLEDLVDSASLP